MSRFIKLTNMDGECYVDAALVGVVSTHAEGYGVCISDREGRQLLWGVGESAAAIMQKVNAARKADA